MNERIRELKQQALHWSGENVNRNLYSNYEIEQKEYEKFAELIVKECLEACSRANEIRHFVPPTQEQVVLSCMREIETTFRS